MTISSMQLIKAIIAKDVNAIHEQLKIAVKDSTVLIKNPNALEQFSIAPKIGIARNALNTPIAKGKCTAATKVASYLLDPRVGPIEKKQWGSILVDMLIIGCDYKQANPEDNNNIINYLMNCKNIAELKQICDVYNDGKLDLKKLVAFKESNILNVFPEAPNYVSLAGLSANNSVVVNQSDQHKVMLVPALLNQNESPREPEPTTPLLSDSMALSKKPANDVEEDTSCCCWPFGR